jgi:hypothetical protein
MSYTSIMSMTDAAVEVIDDEGVSETRIFRFVDVVQVADDSMKYVSLMCDDGYMFRQVPVRDVEISPQRLTAVGLDSEYSILLRPVNETDGYFFSPTDYPLPVPVISGLLNGDDMPDQLTALVDDEGDVITLMLSTDRGLYLRFDGAWRQLPYDDDSPVDGLSVVDVAGPSVDVYDSADLLDQTISVLKLPLAPGETYNGILRTDVDSSDTEEDSQTITSAAQIISQPRAQYPIIASVEDVDEALEIASQDPSVRWYVEKRIHALGLDVEIPWGGA